MTLTRFLAATDAVSSAAVVALLILATLLVSIVLAVFIAGAGG